MTGEPSHHTDPATRALCEANRKDKPVIITDTVPNPTDIEKDIATVICDGCVDGI